MILPASSKHPVPCRRGRSAGKPASGGLRGSVWARDARRPCGTRAFAPRGWETQWGAAKSQTGQVWLDPGLTQPNPMIGPAKDLARDVAGLNPYVGVLNTADSLRKDRSPMNIAVSVYSLLPITGQIINAINIGIDAGKLVGTWFTEHILSPMVTNDSRGPQPFDASGHYNPAYDEGAPF